MAKKTIYARPPTGTFKRRQPSPFSRWLLRSVIVAVLVAVYTFLDGIKDRWYIFDPTSLHEIARAAISAHPNNDTRAIMDDIVTRLRSEPRWSQHLNENGLDVESEWFFNNAGGAMGAMFVLHASVTEYLIFFGTPLGTEGHTGRHTADDYFHIIQGAQWAFPAGKTEMEVYAPGSQHHLPRGAVKQYKMHEGCWALEYARGWIPPMLPFGLADVISSTLDFPTFGRTAWITGREMILNLIKGKI